MSILRDVDGIIIIWPYEYYGGSYEYTHHVKMQMLKHVNKKSVKCFYNFEKTSIDIIYCFKHIFLFLGATVVR